MLVYFRCVRGRSGFYDRVIRWYSRSPYTHAEFCWPLTDPNPPEYAGAQPHGGVQIRRSGYLGAALYDTFGVVIRDEKLAPLTLAVQRSIGLPYDFRAIAGMVFPALDHGQRSAAYFCSEFVFRLLAKAGTPLLRMPIRDADRVTPRDLAVSPLALKINRRAL